MNATSTGMLIPPDRVLLDSEAGSKRILIAEMLRLLPSIDMDLALEVVLTRERLGTTGIGHGVALPHGRMCDLAEPVILLARHKQGIDFASIDGKPVYVVLLLLAPDNADRAHLEMLAHLARLLQKPGMCEAIQTAQSCEEISALFPKPTATP